MGRRMKRRGKLKKIGREESLNKNNVGGVQDA